ncbi:MAG: purine-binding chemotaxis protein CheW [Okeania sp. SIO2H7]|nr:purine-binding chemotaxis protein CheW [Okeania sp. SIO2H7]
METLPYLIFSVKGALIGVEALSVKEIFLLPEVTAIAETPPIIVGVIDLRGDILTVVDLNILLGYEEQEYSLTDSLVVLEGEEKNGQIGIIVSEVFEVKNIPSDSINKEVYGDNPEAVGGHRFIAGVARVEDDIVMLLSSKHLIRYVEMPRLKKLKETEIRDKKIPLDKKKSFLFAPNISPEERRIFRERAKNLREQSWGEDFTGLMPLAVIGLNEEYFGVNLEVVREFTDINKITPIPCTPDRIVGNMNLRGEILTLVDIRGLLNMPMKKVAKLSKAMIIEVGDVVAGAIVEEVFDVLYLNPSDIKSIPTAVHSNNTYEEYLIGTAKYGEKMMSIVDLQKIMTQGGLVVEEYL